MNHREIATRTLEGLLVVAVVAVVAGQAVGQPVLVSYVESGSMAPTLEAGDGFLVVPAALAGPVEPGDVVVFEAERLHGGGLTTHRVVEETPRGYITKGDANPFPDQADEEPPVKEAQIVGVVVRIGGEVVAVPHLGTLAGGLQSLLAHAQRGLATTVGLPATVGTRVIAYLLFGAGVLAYAASVVRDRRRAPPGGDSPRRRGDGVDTPRIVGLLVVVILVSTTASMVIPAGATEYGVISADNDQPGIRMIAEGGSESTAHAVRNTGLVPVVVFLEPASDGVEVRPHELHVGRFGSRTATVTLSVPPENGYYRRHLVEHRYLAVLPPATIRSLYRVHPWLPLVVIDGLVVGAFLLGAAAVLGIDTRRFHPGTDGS